MNYSEYRAFYKYHQKLIHHLRMKLRHLTHDEKMSLRVLDIKEKSVIIDYVAAAEPIEIDIFKLLDKT